MARERTFAATALPSSGRVIPSPFQFYTTGEDNLRVLSYNSKAGVSLKIALRTIDTAGVIQANEHDHTPNSDYTKKTSEISLGSGSIVNVNVRANAGAPLVGQTFVIVQLIRGLGAAAIVLGTLLQGYVTTQQALGWPGSPIESSIAGGGYQRTITGTAFGAGAEPFERVPTGARWELLSMRARLTTSAVAGARQPALLYDDGTNFYAQTVNPGQLGATNIGIFLWSQGLPFTATVPGFNLIGGLPLHLILSSGHRLRTFTLNLDAGDQYDALLFVVREWLEANS